MPKKKSKPIPRSAAPQAAADFGASTSAAYRFDGLKTAGIELLAAR
jgi:hypothetical protein